MIVHRTDMRSTIARLLSKLTGHPLDPVEVQEPDEPDEPDEGDDAPPLVAAGDE